MYQCPSCGQVLLGCDIYPKWAGYCPACPDRVIPVRLRVPVVDDEEEDDDEIYPVELRRMSSPLGGSTR